ncbi:MAG: hypothetical protein M3440_05350, partial [Chloroflexota bacterium]|nr:hypothetical protein [Chloroflexota bacterium]
MIEPFYERDGIVLFCGDNRTVLPQLESESISAVCTDPPYGLEFMGKEWDKLTTGKQGNAALMDRSNFIPSKSKFKNGVGTKIGAPKKNPRCRKCDRLKFDHEGRKCACDAPDYDTRTREYARDMQDWHQVWAELVRDVMKPGAHLLAFGGTRTSHRMVCAIEDAGFEIRDSALYWGYSTG